MSTSSRPIVACSPATIVACIENLIVFRCRHIVSGGCFLLLRLDLTGS